MYKVAVQRATGCGDSTPMVGKTNDRYLGKDRKVAATTGTGVNARVALVR